MIRMGLGVPEWLCGGGFGVSVVFRVWGIGIQGSELKPEDLGIRSMGEFPQLPGKTH